MLCPICNGPAENITPGGFDGLVVKCATCGPYEIAGTVRVRLAKLRLEDRPTVLQKAKRFAAPGARPTISSTSF